MTGVSARAYASRRLVVLGGSGASTPELAEALGAWPGGPEARPRLEVVLHGRDTAKLELVTRAFDARVGAIAGPTVSVQSTSELDSALDGADAVLVQVRVGGLAARVFDESFPREDGVPGEETMGPGGFANALRTVPALRPTWEAIARIAPSALVVNLTNPSGIVTAAAIREAGLHAVSVCDSPVTLTETVAARLSRDVDAVRRSYVGGNHFGWWVPRDDGELEAVADLATGLSANEVGMLGALPAPYDRYYLVAERILEGQRGGSTRGEQLQVLERQLLDGYGAEVEVSAGRRTSPTPRRGAVWYGKAVVPLLAAWWNGVPAELIVGLADPVDKMPSGVVVEGTARVAPGEIERVSLPTLPTLPHALLQAHLTYEALVLEALAAGPTRSTLVAALAANPMVRDLDRAGRLVDTILAQSPNG